jgi:membrane protease YdiL (CAAX protease family)
VAPYVPIICFFLLTYVLSWFGLVGNHFWPSAAWPWPMNPFGPLIAAPLTIWWFGGGAAVGAWWRRILRFRAPLWVYATAFLLPLAIILGSIGAALWLGTPSNPLPAREGIEFLILIPIMLLAGPMPEELSFRGHGQHVLQQAIAPLAAALWIGLGVVIWHLPLFFVAGLPPVIALTLPAVSVVYAWLYARGGSLWPLVALHWVQNYFGGEFLGPMFAPEHSTTWLAILTACYLLWALVIAWREGPTLGLNRAA